MTLMVIGGSRSRAILQLGNTRIWRVEQCRGTEYRVRNFTVRPEDQEFWSDSDVFNDYSEALERAQQRY